MKRTLIAAAVLALLAGASSPAASAENTCVHPLETLPYYGPDTWVSVQSFSRNQQGISFELLVRNAKRQVFFVEIRDEQGEIIHRESSRIAEMQRRYIIPENLSGPVRIIVYFRNNRNRQVYELNPITRQVEDLQLRRVQ